MKTLTITKENCIKFINRQFNWHGDPIPEVQQQIKRLCKVAPEFTHNPMLAIVANQESYFESSKILFQYISDFYYGYQQTTFRFLTTWFGFAEEHFVDIDTVQIDFESFGVKKASEAKIKKMGGDATCY